MYAIYGNIYYQYTPNVSIYIYTPYMYPMGDSTQAWPNTAIRLCQTELWKQTHFLRWS